MIVSDWLMSEIQGDQYVRQDVRQEFPKIVAVLWSGRAELAVVKAAGLAHYRCAFLMHFYPNREMKTGWRSSESGLEHVNV
jgi:hypothetical protein